MTSITVLPEEIMRYIFTMVRLPRDKIAFRETSGFFSQSSSLMQLKITYMNKITTKPIDRKKFTCVNADCHNSLIALAADDQLYFAFEQQKIALQALQSALNFVDNIRTRNISTNIPMQIPFLQSRAEISRIRVDICKEEKRQAYRSCRAIGAVQVCTPTTYTTDTTFTAPPAKTYNRCMPYCYTCMKNQYRFIKAVTPFKRLNFQD